ncbi:MAG: uroporphyrinogen-III C-methyltransferase [Candidatus Brocadiia bacterium]
MSSGTVYLVGAGPGHPGLITVRGKKLLQRADTIVYDRLIPRRLLNCARETAQLCYAGKRPGDHRMSQDDINELLITRARQGDSVVRLKGGDPFVFGRGGEEAMALQEADVQYEVVPGITAGLAAPAWSGIPATHRNVSSAIGLVTGHHAADTVNSPLDWNALADWEGTLSFYMGVAKLDNICDRLIDGGKDPHTPAAIIERATTARQRCVQGELENISGRARDNNISPPAILVVGEVAKLRNELQWSEKKPLSGRCVVVTRPRAQAGPMADQLEELGADPILLPAIKIIPAADTEPLQDAISRIHNYDWLVFTSVNGVGYFFKNLSEQGKDARNLAGARIAAIGSATADRLWKKGVRADMVPERYTTEGLIEAFEELEQSHPLRILCPRSSIAPPDLVEGLVQAGYEVDEVDAYDVVTDCSGAEEVKDIMEEGRPGWVTFTSSSTVQKVVGELGSDHLATSSLRMASIGPRTSHTLREEGLEPDVEASPHTVGALVDAMVEFETTPQESAR